MNMIVGIDFGTTNVRISTWEEGASNPQPREIGPGINPMPAVVALHLQPDNSVEKVVGEEADDMEDGQDKVVIRNIKRWALSSDPYVKWRLDISGTECPHWWNPESKCVDVWGKQFQVQELIADVLREAVSRADLPSEFEWRAGCPVHAGYEYRRMFSETLKEIAGKGQVDWVVDEPILFLVAALNNDPDSILKRPGSYLIYDLGGGSFDCALVGMDNQEYNRTIVVSGADGHPLLGGSNIDQALAHKLNYAGKMNILRLAKEQVTPDNPVARINNDLSLQWSDVEAVLGENKFLRLSLMALRDSYVSSEAFSSLGEADDDQPDSMIISPPSENTGEVRFAWQLTYGEMGENMDGVILYGGPTLSPYFPQSLSRWFPLDENDHRKVLYASDLIKIVDDPAITGVSIGACYYPSRQNFHEVPSRLPYRVVLENRLTGNPEDKVEYQPHQHFVDTFQPTQNFTSKWLQQERDNPQEYELIIADSNGVVLERHFVDGYLEDGNRLPATSLRLIIDRLGPVCVEKKSEGIGLSWTKKFEVIKNPPWQSAEQRAALRRRQARKQQKEEARRQQSRQQLEAQARHPEP